MKKQGKWLKNLLKIRESADFNLTILHLITNNKKILKGHKVVSYLVVKLKTMEPFERFKKLNTEGNLWIYILSLGKEVICDNEVSKLIFERFGFLPGNLLLKSVLYRLRRKGYIQTEKYKGKKAFKTTEKGMKELEAMKSFCQELLQKI
jgi:hypothetical protein